uniref:Polycystin cation channel PKD1/PKD2 domain-containing protein n=1 Tax=Heterosigma akashiwo TaxID=2829 RepID=A0A7S3Y3T9_HETAK
MTDEFTEGLDYTGITSAPQWYDWATEIFAPAMYPDTWYNGDNRTTEEELIQTDFGSYRFGVARVRIQRVQEGAGPNCAAHAADAAGLVDRAPLCYPTLTDTTQATEPWGGVAYTPAAESESTDYDSYWTGMSYDGGGYIFNIPNNLNGSLEFFNSLASNESGVTIDEQTRFVMLEFNVYNPNIDLFAVGNFAIEFLSSGYILTSSLIRPVNLYNVYKVVTNNPHTWYETVNFILEMIFYLLAAGFLVQAMREVRLVGFAKWARDPENAIEAAYLALILCQMCLRFYLWSRIGGIVGEGYLGLETTQFGPIDRITWLVQEMDNVTAVTAILFFGKVLTYMRAERTTRLFEQALVLSFFRVGSLLPIVVVVGGGFAVAFQLVFGRDVADYATFGRALFSMFRALIGDFDLQQLRYSNSYLGPGLFVLFIVFAYFIVLSMFLSIVDASLEEKRTNAEQELLLTKQDPNTSDLLWRDFRHVAWRVRHFLQDQVCRDRAGGRVAPTTGGDGDGMGGSRESKVDEEEEGFGSEQADDNRNKEEVLLSDSSEEHNFPEWLKSYRVIHKQLAVLSEKQKLLNELLDSARDAIVQSSTSREEGGQQGKDEDGGAPAAVVGGAGGEKWGTASSTAGSTHRDSARSPSNIIRR